jgi:Zn finger protein HypA/HybF involved in hydrogenase expression
MGSSRDYICPTCGYSAHVCGGHDWGIVAVLKTFTCKECHTLSDVQIGEYGRNYKDMVNQNTIDPIPEELICPGCKSYNVRPWNPNNRPCPKCGTRMKEDPMSEMMWD